MRCDFTAAEIGCGVCVKIYCAVQFAMPRGSKLEVIYMAAATVVIEIPI